MQFNYFVVCYVFDDVCEPLLRIDVVELATGKEAVKRGGAFCSVVRSGKEVVFATYGYRSDAVFNKVVVDMQVAIVQVILQALPQWGYILDGLTNG